MGKNQSIEKLEADLVKKLGPEHLEALQAMGVDQLKERLTTLAMHEQETLLHESTNETLAKAAEELASMKAPYKDTIKGITLQRQYIAASLEKMGK